MRESSIAPSTLIGAHAKAPSRARHRRERCRFAPPARYAPRCRSALLHRSSRAPRHAGFDAVDVAFGDLQYGFEIRARDARNFRAARDARPHDRVTLCTTRTARATRASRPARVAARRVRPRSPCCGDLGDGGRDRCARRRRRCARDRRPRALISASRYESRRRVPTVQRRVRGHLHRSVSLRHPPRSALLAAAAPRDASSPRAARSPRRSCAYVGHGRLEIGIA